MVSPFRRSPLGYDNLSMAFIQVWSSKYQLGSAF